MRVLDLDLDFFLNEINTDDVGRNSGRRLDEQTFHPWTEAEVREFLEVRCALSTEAPVPGRVVTDHHEAFFFWRELLHIGKLIAPFDIVHIDAHADLGYGDRFTPFLMGEFLHKSVEERQRPEQFSPEKLHAGNYLLYVVAARWVRELTFVTHPEWRDDLPPRHFKDYDETSEAIQLKKCDPLFDHDNRGFPPLEDVELEPPVPFHLVEGADYLNDSPFSFVVLSRSPGYTPQQSDRLIPIIAEYIKPI